MKIQNFKSYSVLILLVFGLLFTSCDNEEATETNSPDLSYSEIIQSSEADKAIAAIDDITINLYDTQESSETSRTTNTFNNLPDCVTITFVAQQNYRELTLDFGSDGCMVYGNVYKGQMILSWERNPEVQQVLITRTLQDFYFNAINVIGGGTILRELSNTSGNPESTHTLDYTFIWANGAQASRGGTIIREWVEGFASGNWLDNVVEVTGNWTTTFVNGNTHTYVVDIPLRREFQCYYFVSGSIDVERTNFSGVLDYGDGACDNEATFTFANGDVIDIIIN